MAITDKPMAITEAGRAAIHKCCDYLEQNKDCQLPWHGGLAEDYVDFKYGLGLPDLPCPIQREATYNSSYGFMGAQPPSSPISLKMTFDMSKSLRDRFLGHPLNNYTEFIVITADDAYMVTLKIPGPDIARAVEQLKDLLALT